MRVVLGVMTKLQASQPICTVKKKTDPSNLNSNRLYLGRYRALSVVVSGAARRTRPLATQKSTHAHKLRKDNKLRKDCAQRKDNKLRKDTNAKESNDHATAR